MCLIVPNMSLAIRFARTHLKSFYSKQHAAVLNFEDIPTQLQYVLLEANYTKIRKVEVCLCADTPIKPTALLILCDHLHLFCDALRWCDPARINFFCFSSYHLVFFRFLKMFLRSPKVIIRF